MGQASWTTLKSRIEETLAAVLWPPRRARTQAAQSDGARAGSPPSLTTILATIDNAVWSIAADTYETLYLNPAAARIYGQTASAFYADPKLFMNIVRRVLQETDLPPSDLELEITESVFLRNIEETVRTLTEGVAISLDDFGTGYSSLNYLRRLPIDQLKIDGSFVRGLSADPKAEVLLSQIIQLGHAMHLEVVAECVESENRICIPR
jgi:hypothetical protein